jgi:hypothetical protein
MISERLNRRGSFSFGAGPAMALLFLNESGFVAGDIIKCCGWRDQAAFFFSCIPLLS